MIFSTREDTPGEPVGPIIFSNISEGKCTMSWKPPENDGCSEISHFIIEKRETSKISWALVSDECTQCTFNATKLMKTNEYQFRVSAVNKFGVSRALESTPIIAQLQYSRSKFIWNFHSVNSAFKYAIFMSLKKKLIYHNCFHQPFLIAQEPLRLLK